MSRNDEKQEGNNDGGRWKIWLFYLLILFFAGLTIKDVGSLIIEYASGPKKANMNMMFNTSISFPNMTFCMPRYQAMSHFVGPPKEAPTKNSNNTNSTDQNSNDRQESKLTDISKATEKELETKFKERDAFLNKKLEWKPEMVQSAYDAISEINLLEREAAAHQTVKLLRMFSQSKRNALARTIVKKWLKVIDDRNVTFDEFFQRVGIEVLKHSMRVFKRMSYDEEEEAPFNMTTKISWISQEMLCFQPIFMDTNSFRPINEQGDFFQLILFHNSAAYKKREADCMSLDLHGRPTIDHRALEGKGRVKDGIEEELCIGQIHEAEIQIRAHYQMIANKEPSTACREYEDSDSEYNCRSKCRMQMLQSLCNCIPRTMEQLADDDMQKKLKPCDYESCSVSEENANTTDQDCAKQCYPDCNQLRYDINLDQKGRSLIQNKTAITLQWGALEYLDLSQEYTYTWYSFIAALGGAIGVWLGLSVLSLIQLTAFFTMKGQKKVKYVGSTRRTHTMSTVDHHEGAGGGKHQENRAAKLAENPFDGPMSKNPFNEVPIVGKKEAGAKQEPQQQPQNARGMGTAQQHQNGGTPYAYRPSYPQNETRFGGSRPA